MKSTSDVFSFEKKWLHHVSPLSTLDRSIYNISQWRKTSLYIVILFCFDELINPKKDDIFVVNTNHSPSLEDPFLFEENPKLFEEDLFMFELK